MNSRATVTIGIPAYNEKDNIDILLRHLLEQETSRAVIKEIIVVSDGSTDSTVRKAKSIRSPFIRVISQRVRQGQGAAQNQIAKRAKSDILVLLNADILPINTHLIERLAELILDNPGTGLVGGNTASVHATSVVEWVLGAAHELKQNLYIRKENGNNIYMCHGRVRAFTKAVYSTIVWPTNAPEDAYSYLFSKKLGYNFLFARRATVYFRSPSKLADHIRQSNRFRSGMEALKAYFDPDIINKEFYVPPAAFLRTVIRFLIRHPFSTSLYMLISLYVRLFTSKKTVNLTTWEVAKTSKKVIAL